MRDAFFALAPTEVHLFAVTDRPEIYEALLHVFQLAPEAFEFADGGLDYLNQVVCIVHEGVQALAKHIGVTFGGRFGGNF
jgi:hypothetical protein